MIGSREIAVLWLQDHWIPRISLIQGTRPIMVKAKKDLERWSGNTPCTMLQLWSNRTYWAWKIPSQNRWTVLLILSQDAKWSQQEFSLLQGFNFFLSQTNTKSTLICKPLGGEVRPRATSPEGKCWVIGGFLQGCWLSHPNGSFGDDIFSSFSLCTFHSKALKYHNKEVQSPQLPPTIHHKWHIIN